MGFLERLNGTKHPAGGVTPRTAAEVRDVLLAVSGPQSPYRVRLAGPSENADLIAAWRIQHRSFGEDIDLRLIIRMRLDPHGRVVRALQEQRSSTQGRMSASREYSRGGGFSVEWTYERGTDGRRRRVTTLDTREMGNALRQAALGAGWTWRPRRFRL
ncbi:hypothetical protein ACH41H_24245 [Streptomyces sp. NPDC020800]|uniref:hypothetical protein n=1 Tax=Streptomyces sp. NPDC020800 TaxID=3365092 RepID=UPI00379D5261